MNRWKRMCKFLIPLALALFFVGLSRCGITETAIEAMGIEKMALQYLSEQYSAEFTIINWWREPREKSPIPIPSIIPSYNFELEVISDQFPEDKFHLHYRKDLDTKKWEWADDYYTILLNACSSETFTRSLWNAVVVCRRMKVRISTVYDSRSNFPKTGYSRKTMTNPLTMKSNCIIAMTNLRHKNKEHSSFQT